MNKNISFTITFTIVCIFLLSTSLLADTCYLAKNGFAVLQPYMVTKGCFLFNHGSNVDLRHQSDLVITRKETLHPDPIQAEFLRFIIDRKLITLKKGTQVFSCNYELETIAKDFKLSGTKGGTTRTRGYELPQFTCSGALSMWVPVRPVHERECYWIAVPLLACDEMGKELIPISVTDSMTVEDK